MDPIYAMLICVFCAVVCVVLAIAVYAELKNAWRKFEAIFKIARGVATTVPAPPPPRPAASSPPARSCKHVPLVFTYVLQEGSGIRITSTLEGEKGERVYREGAYVVEWCQRCGAYRNEFMDGQWMRPEAA